MGVNINSEEEETFNMSEPTVKRKFNDDNKNVIKKKPKLDKDLYKQPTVEELNQFKETENLFHSNLFRLQIEELLAETKIKGKYKKLFSEWFTKFKDHINAFEDSTKFELNNLNVLEYLGIELPMTELPNELNGGFQFMTSSNIDIVGSYSVDATIGPTCTVDIMIEMPENLFRKIDCQNFRYMKKRAIYLSFIAKQMKEDLVKSVFFIGDSDKPMLKLVPAGKLGDKIIVYVHLAMQETSFTLNKFTPEKSNIKPKWFNCNGSNEEPLTAAPHYNNVILRDLTMSSTNDEVIKMIKEYTNIRDGIILLKVWLRQREFGNGVDAFNGHVITMYVLYLLVIKKLNTYMSSYQILRNTWHCLAESDWCKKGISICQLKESQARIEEYHKYYDCVFLNFNGYQNIAANISENTFEYIRYFAKSSLKCLDDAHNDSFATLFLRKVPFCRSFDHLIKFHSSSDLESIADEKCGDVEKLEYGEKRSWLGTKLVLKILKKGLGNRVSKISVLPRELKEWKLTDKIPTDDNGIVIGLELDPEHCYSVVDKGPGANLPEAEAFRAFWGKKSDLRRFKDGSICEAVIWGKGKTIAEKRILCKRLITYLLKEKFDFDEKKNFLYFANQMEQLLQLNRVQVPKVGYGTGEEASLAVLSAFNTLEQELTSLTDLPLSISGVQGCSSVLRYTDVFPPLAIIRRADNVNTVDGKYHLLIKEDSLEQVPQYMAPIEASIQLTTSGKWPDELEAVQKMKAAFHIQIAESLRRQVKAKAHACSDHVDVFKDGFVFRLRVAHQKEIALMKKQSSEDGVIKYRDSKESIKLEKKLFHLPKLTGALHGLHSQYPSFGPSCCLAKRWLSSQMIGDWHMPHIAVELLIASMYLKPEPYKPSQMPQTTFIRFLELFAREFWTSGPIIVNFNNEMSSPEITEIENLFGTSRETLPLLFISTPYDKQSSMWTKKAPSLLILNRINSLAKEALKILDSSVLSSQWSKYSTIFNPPVAGYDCLIHLDPKFNSRILEAVHPLPNSEVVDLHPFKPHSKQKIPIIDFNPVDRYLQDLRDGYNNFALFFHDTHGGSVIGVVMKPSTFEWKEFKVTNADGRKLDSNKKLVVNMSAMIEDFYVLGRGIVTNIEVQSTKFSV